MIIAINDAGGNAQTVTGSSGPNETVDPNEASASVRRLIPFNFTPDP